MTRIEPLDHREPSAARRMHAVMVLAHAQEALLISGGGAAPFEQSADDVASADATCFGAFDGTDLIGSVSLEADDEPGQISIASLVVHPDHQRRGVARALVDQVLRHGRGDTFSVCTTAANAPALALYQSMGFVAYRVGTIGPAAVAIVKLRRQCSADPVVRALA